MSQNSSRTEPAAEVVLDTPHGAARLVTFAASADVPVQADLLLSHGAGGGIEARDLQALAAALPVQGYPVHLLEQPWRRAGRRIATAPPTLDAALGVAVTHLATERPLVLGGRSAGARSAVRTAASLNAAGTARVEGVLALSFPLHPPKRPEKSRWAELAGAGVPVLVVQGERDAMGRPEEFPDLPQASDAADGFRLDMVVVPGGDHSLTVPKRGALDEDGALQLVVEGTLEWLTRVPG